MLENMNILYNILYGSFSRNILIIGKFVMMTVQMRKLLDNTLAEAKQEKPKKLF